MQIDLTLKNYRCFPDSHPARLAVRKRLTALVGPNNSGKSALLRFFFEFRHLLQAISAPSNELLAALRGGNSVFAFQGISDLMEVFSNDNSRDLVIEINLSPEEGDDAASIEKTPNRLVIDVVRAQNVFKIREFRTPLMAIAPAANISWTPGDGRYYLTRDNVRIAWLDPLLSAIRPLAQTVYIGAFRNAINVGGSQNYFDIQVGEQFLQAWRRFKTGTSKQQAAGAFRLTDDIKHIFGFDDLEINTSDDNKTLQVFVDGRPFRLDELGSGLAQFILVLANVATREQGYILLDEPELNLHPSLQLDFLTSVASYASDGIVFATHSIGLARSAGHQIYALKRLQEGVSEMRPLEGLPRLAEFLGELSFSGYRELGFQRVLLVEGQTDVTTMQQLLRKRNLDHKIVVLPLGGAGMITDGREGELSEIQRISPNILAIIDSERSAAGQPLAAERQAFVETCRNLGIAIHVLDRRAIENYFPGRAVRAIKSDKYRALQPFEALATIPLPWAKAENWRIAREMTLDEIGGTDLHLFLNSL